MGVRLYIEKKKTIDTFINQCGLEEFVNLDDFCELENVSEWGVKSSLHDTGIFNDASIGTHKPTVDNKYYIERGCKYTTNGFKDCHDCDYCYKYYGIFSSEEIIKLKTKTKDKKLLELLSKCDDDNYHYLTHTEV